MSAIKKFLVGTLVGAGLVGAGVVSTLAVQKNDYLRSAWNSGLASAEGWYAEREAREIDYLRRKDGVFVYEGNLEGKEFEDVKFEYRERVLNNEDEMKPYPLLSVWHRGIGHEYHFNTDSDNLGYWLREMPNLKDDTLFRIVETKNRRKRFFDSIGRKYDNKIDEFFLESEGFANRAREAIREKKRRALLGV